MLVKPFTTSLSLPSLSLACPAPLSVSFPPPISISPISPLCYLPLSPSPSPLSFCLLLRPLSLSPSRSPFLWNPENEEVEAQKSRAGSPNNTIGSTTGKSNILKASSFATQTAKLEAQILEHKTNHKLRNTCAKKILRESEHKTGSTNQGTDCPSPSTNQTKIGNPKVVCAPVCAFPFIKKTQTRAQTTTRTNQTTNCQSPSTNQSTKKAQLDENKNKHKHTHTHTNSKAPAQKNTTGI